MTNRALKSAVQHPVRLDMLGCLDRRATTVDSLSEKIGMEVKLVAHHLKTLIGFALVAETDERDDAGQPVYIARLKNHPTWVTREVNGRRRARAKAA
jgi:predicted transcriptional regulator